MRNIKGAKIAYSTRKKKWFNSEKLMHSIKRVHLFDFTLFKNNHLSLLVKQSFSKHRNMVKKRSYFFFIMLIKSMRSSENVKFLDSCGEILILEKIKIYIKKV